MFGITQRNEFQGRRLKGTAIELATATQGAAADFLRITYPTMDVLKPIADHVAGYIRLLGYPLRKTTTEN